jgi:hypothetical protein
LGRSHPGRLASLLIGISLAFLVVATLIIAWRKGWPLWSASWFLYATWVIYAILDLYELQAIRIGRNR